MRAWLQVLAVSINGGVPNYNGDPTPWGLLRIVAGVFWGAVIAALIFFAVNTALRNADVSHHLAFAFAAVVVYAVVAIAMNVNRTISVDRF